MKWPTHAMMSMQIALLVIIIFFISAALVVILYRETATAGQRGKDLQEGTTNRIGLKELDIVELSVSGTSTNNDQADAFQATLRKKPASQNINLNQVSIFLTLQDNTSFVYTYNPVIDCTLDQSYNASNTSMYNNQNMHAFGVRYAVHKDIVDNIITKDDILEVCFKTPRIVFNSEPISIIITPSDGKSFSFDGNLPESFQWQKNVFYHEGIIT
jgi:archaellin